MSFRQDHSGGNKAVALLATCFVVLGGAVCCAAIVMAGNPEHLESTIIPVAGVIAGAVFLLWLLRERPPASGRWTNWNWLTPDDKQRVAYKVKPKIPASQRVTTPPAPPTAESIRALTGREPGGLKNTWVPAAAPPAPPQSDPSESSP